MISAIIGIFCAILAVALVGVVYAAGKRRREKQSGQVNRGEPSTPHRARATGKD
jgi:hypothetical protein